MSHTDEPIYSADAKLSSDQASLLQLPSNTNAELVKKIRRCSEKMTESLYMLANEPVLGCFRIYEHLAKSGVQMATKANQMRQLKNELNGGLFDVEYSIESVRKMSASDSRFREGHESLKNALFYKQQLDYEQKRKTEQQRLSS